MLVWGCFGCNKRPTSKRKRASFYNVNCICFVCFSDGLVLDNFLPKIRKSTSESRANQKKIAYCCWDLLKKEWRNKRRHKGDRTHWQWKYKAFGCYCPKSHWSTECYFWNIVSQGRARPGRAESKAKLLFWCSMDEVAQWPEGAWHTSFCAI